MSCGMFGGETPSLKEEAEKDLSAISAALALTESNLWGCEIHIGGVVVGVSDNTRVRQVLYDEQKEIQKFLRGESNTWE